MVEKKTENIICKNCGAELSRWMMSSIRVDQNAKTFLDGTPIPEAFHGFSHIQVCHYCHRYLFDDYMGFSMDDFFMLILGDDGASRETKGKALIRYFALDKMLGVEHKESRGD